MRLLYIAGRKWVDRVTGLGFELGYGRGEVCARRNAGPKNVNVCQTLDEIIGGVRNMIGQRWLKRMYPRTPWSHILLFGRKTAPRTNRLPLVVPRRQKLSSNQNEAEDWGCEALVAQRLQQSKLLRNICVRKGLA